MQAEQMAEQRALARTAPAHDDHDFTLPRLKVNIVKNLPGAVVGDQMADVDGDIGRVDQGLNT